MIALFANWTGNALVLGTDIADARGKLTSMHCPPDTEIGDGADQLTALDVGPEFRFVEHLPPLYRAIQLYPEISADREGK